MLIGIDGNEANVKDRVGVHQYGFELIWGIKKIQNEWKDRHNVIVYLKSPPQKDFPKESKFFKYKVIPGGKIWIITKLTPHLFFSKKRPGVFFSPSHYVPPISPMPRVCSIMDLGYLKFSGQFKTYDFWQLKYWSAISIFVSKAVIAISNSTKKDIVRLYPFASKKVRVTQLAYDKKGFNVDISKNDVRRVKKKYSIVNDYVLFLSTLKPSKNIEGLLAAWKMLVDKFPGSKLVIAGKKGWLYESIFEKAQKLGLKDKVVFTGYVDEKDKPALFAGAKVFVLPSFWEGFGLDVLNAMASEVAVVAANRGSLPEVVGDAGILVDPYNIKDIAKGIKIVLSMGKIEYNRLVKKGLKQAKKFSWEKTARETLKILEEAAK